MDPTLNAFWLLAWPLLMGLAAVGGLLWIKIHRRREGTTHPGMTGAVPVRPLSAADARQMARRYLWVAALLVMALILLGVLFGGATW